MVQVIKGQGVVGGVLISRHLYPEGTEVNGLGLPVLDGRGFCPGSFNAAKEVTKLGK